MQDLERQFQDALKLSDLPTSASSQSFFQQFDDESQLNEQLQRLHNNLESRLRPFWASALVSQKVQVSVFAYLPCASGPELVQALLTANLHTGSGGFFSHTFRIAWDDICVHPVGYRIAFDDNSLEHELHVKAQVIDPEAVSNKQTTAETRIPITQSAVQVISDIDDTVKLSKILDGARVVFHHVFVKDLRDTVIPGMTDWYKALWKRGARFHYVVGHHRSVIPCIEH